MSEDAKWGFLKNIINIDRFFAGEGQSADSAEAPAKAASTTKPASMEKAAATSATASAQAASAAETVKNAPPVYDESKDITTKAFGSS